MAFSDEQVAQAIRESMAQGFTLDQSLSGAASKFGVPEEQLERAKASLGSAKTDVVGNLQNAGLKESPADLIQQLNKTQPDFTKGFDFSNIGKMGDESTGRIEGPSTNFGGYDIKALGEFADVGEGSYAPTGTLGGYEATKTETQQNGKPLISTLKYDASGALTGRTVRAYEGSDSGTEYVLDAAGKVIGSRKFDDSEAWKGTALPLLNMAAIAFMPGLSGFLGGGALGAAGAGAAFGGAGAALRGAEGSDLLKAAAMGALGGAGGTLAAEAGKFAGGLFENPLLSAAAKGAVEGGIKALPGAIARGDKGQVLTGALLGGASGAADVATSNVDLPFTRQQLEAGVNLARAVSSGNVVAAANSAAALIDNPDITIATRAATLLNAARIGNTSAVLAAAQLLDNALRENLKPGLTSTVKMPRSVTGEDFDLEEIRRLGDVTTLGDVGETISGELPETISGLGILPSESAGDQTVAVTGSTLPIRGLSNVEDLLSALSPTQVDVTGKKFIKPVKGGEGVVTTTGAEPVEQVDVEGKKFIKPVKGGEGVATQPTVTSPVIPTDTGDTGPIEVIGKRIKPVKGGEGVATTPTTTTTTTTTPVTTTPVTTKTTTPPKITTTTTAAPVYRPFTPIPEAPAQQPSRPGLADVFYGKGAVRFGPDAPSMADVTDFQGRKAQARRSMELALEGAGGENQAEDAYERLMSLAQESPAATVDQLMQIIEGVKNA